MYLNSNPPQPATVMLEVLKAHATHLEGSAPVWLESQEGGVTSVSLGPITLPVLDAPVIEPISEYYLIVMTLSKATQIDMVKQLSTQEVEPQFRL